MRRLGHVPALDGLRGLAVAAVVLYHFRTSRWIPGGWLGVDVFFVLSGFLITSLLLEEWDGAGRVRLGAFYLRRALRLLPALALFLVVWTVVLVLAGSRADWFWTVPGQAGATAPGNWLALLGRGVAGAAAYATNWLSAVGVDLPPMGHLWSLAIEEQFYLLWPPLLVWVLRRHPDRVLDVSVGCAALSAAMGFALWIGSASEARIYFGTDVRAQGMLIGAVAAVARPHVRGWHALGAGGLLLWAALFVGETNRLRYQGLLTALAVAAVVVVLWAVGHPRSLDHRWLVWLGRRSYAVYLWHYPVATWVNGLGWWGCVAGIGASLGLAEASWRLVERRAMARAPRPVRRPASAPA